MVLVILMLSLCVHVQREKRNLQDLNGVYVFNVAEQEYLDRPTARLIKEIDSVEGISSVKRYSLVRVNSKCYNLTNSVHFEILLCFFFFSVLF